MASLVRSTATSLVLALTVAASIPAQATPASSSAFAPAIASRPDVRRALAWLDSNFTTQVDEWIRITRMQAKSEHEQERGAYVRAAMEREGLAVTSDSIGNIVGVRKGTGGGPTLVFAAHMDIVHPLGTDLTVRRSGDTLHAPGVFDNSASVTNMLNVVRALNRANVKTRGDLIFIGTTQEEVGLQGMEHWLDHNPNTADMVVAMDGGLGPINYGALGIYWTRYTLRGEGAHTMNSIGRPHPARALAEAIRSIYQIKVPPPAQEGAVFNVGMLAGGTIFNGIPQEVSFTVDLRTVNPALLDSLDREIESRVARAAAAEKVEWTKQEAQRNRAGGTAAMLANRRNHAVVQTAIDVHRFLGIDLGPRPAVASGSTDANAAVVRGIPAISVGRSQGGNQHTLSEWAHWPSALPATKMILLMAVSLGDDSAAKRTPVQ